MITTNHHLHVAPSLQVIHHYCNDILVKTYPISTAKNGLGCEKGSFKTPIGWHKIRAKIGDRCPINSIFQGRRPTGSIFHPDMLEQFPNTDWILTRILWLSGTELGLNRLGSNDTMQRYIYIHGMADEKKIGLPSSKGCINMKNNDIIELFDSIPTGTTVLIQG